MKEKIIGIYKITNKINGKVYIGQSINIYTRWQEHLRLAKASNKKSSIISKAINKYGIENFNFEILLSYNSKEISKEILNLNEDLYILKYKSTNKKYGYNIKRVDMHDKYNTFYGKHHKASTKKTLSEINKGLKSKKRRAVECIETGKKFISISDAARYYNVHVINIINCIKGVYLKTGGYTWKYIDYTITEEEYMKMEEEYKQIIFKNEIINKEKEKIEEELLSKKVFCIETNKIFSSIEEASKFFSIEQFFIKMNCLNKKSSCKGYHFCFYDDYINGNFKLKTGAKNKIICLETKKIFNSINIASKENHIDRKAITKACGDLKFIAGGFHWQFLKDYEEEKTYTYPPIKKIKCIETNAIFNTATEASNTYHLDASSILKNCRKYKNLTQVKGYHFEFVYI